MTAPDHAGDVNVLDGDVRPVVSHDPRGQLVRQPPLPVRDPLPLARQLPTTLAAVVASPPCLAQPPLPTLQLAAVEPDALQLGAVGKGDTVADPDVDADWLPRIGLDPSRQLADELEFHPPGRTHHPDGSHAAVRLATEADASGAFHPDPRVTPAGMPHPWQIAGQLERANRTLLGPVARIARFLARLHPPEEGPERIVETLERATLRPDCEPDPLA